MRLIAQVCVAGLLLTGALLVFGARAKERKLLPVDEGVRDPSFKAFRDGLLEALRRRDKKFVLSILDPKIRLSFGDDSGVEDFKKYWKIESANSELWDELSTVLSLGGTFDTSGGQRLFCAPYTYSRFPEDLDAFEYAPITGKDVRVRARPGASSRVVATLSYSIVRAEFSGTDGGRSSGWVKIVTPDGKPGYVSDKYIRSPVDYRACFRKARGKWLMTLFVAGD